MQIADAYRTLLAQGRALLERLRLADLRRRALHYARVAAAFFLTLIFLSAVGIVFLAAQSRVRLDPPAATFGFASAGSATLQAVEHLYAMRGRNARGMDGARVFEPGSRRFRERQFQVGAESAAFDVLREVRAGRGERNAEFAELRNLAFEPADAATTAAAVQRVNAAMARGRLELAWEGDVFERLLLKAAARLEDRAAEAASHTHRGRFGLAAPAVEAAFFRARGEAYGWGLILRGVARDTGAGDLAELDAALAALDRAAALQPLFLFNGPRDSAILPNHLAHVALDLELASDALRKASGS
jgi:hypothetical protein